jgi:DtxR family transcriptional regulator, Mn-dependent transcriptional regulator
MNSFTEENYLKAIYKLLEKGEESVSTNALAEKLNNRAASVTEMLRRMAEKGLINYKKYQGVSLTEKGRKVAIATIRKHRLWELFLVDKLGFKWDEVHEIAEELEHINSEELVARLDKYLGYPKHDPHGDPIPDAQGKFQKQQSQMLALMKAGAKCIVTGVVDHSPAFLQYLDKTGIKLGDELQVKERIEYDNSMNVSLNGKKQAYLSNEVAKNVLVKVK